MRVPTVDSERYQRLRTILRGHQNAAVATISKPLFTRTARAFGLLRGKQLELESDAELTILMDHVIYDRDDRGDRGETPVRRYLRQLRETNDPDERAVRDAMARQRYSVFEVASVHPGIGLVLRDLVRGGTIFVVDKAMSGTAPVGALMAERVLPLPDYWVSSGSGFPITPESAWEVEQTIVPALEKSEEDLAAMSPEGNAELAAALIRLGFEEGSTGEVEYR
jgi:hypothetical protein